MNKFLILTISFVLFSVPVLPCSAVNVGTYKTETEYGLIDGFKFNWKKKDKSQKFLEVKENPTIEQSKKEMKNYKESEYERIKYMYDGKAIL